MWGVVLKIVGRAVANPANTTNSPASSSKTLSKAITTTCLRSSPRKSGWLRAFFLRC